MKTFYAIVGTLLFAVGLVGILIPPIPTTPLVLLAAACFARSPDRFREGLLRRKYLGAPLRMLRENRAMKRIQPRFIRRKTCRKG